MGLCQHTSHGVLLPWETWSQTLSTHAWQRHLPLELPRAARIQPAAPPPSLYPSQPLSLMASQPLSLTASQPLSLSASLPHSLSPSQPLSLSASLPHGLSASLPLSLSASKLPLSPQSRWCRCAGERPGNGWRAKRQVGGETSLQAC